MRSSWPVDVVALNPVSCGAVLWCAGGVLRVTVSVKASFALGAGGDADLVAPEPIEREDRLHEDRSIEMNLGQLEERARRAEERPRFLRGVERGSEIVRAAPRRRRGTSAQERRPSIPWRACQR